jgi:hypothetical protein
MRKRSKYRPKGVRIDTMAYVQSGLKKFDDVSVAVTLRIKNHAAMEALRTGTATRNDIDVLIGQGNMAEAFSRLRPDLGADWAIEIRAGQDALLAVTRRGVHAGDRFVCRADELVAINLVTEIHDAQLDQVTVKDMELAMDIINKDWRSGKSRSIFIKEPETA